jgi:hypothetical protein
LFYKCDIAGIVNNFLIYLYYKKGQLMIKPLIITLLLGSITFIYAAESNTTADSSNISEQELKRAIAKEEKYAKERTFYNAKTYDFKGSEVNKESLKKIPVIEMDDPSIDSDSILGMSEEENLSW